MHNPILARITQLTHDVIPLHPSSICAEDKGADIWEITISCHDYCRGNPQTELAGPVPNGIACTIISRVADDKILIMAADDEIKQYMREVRRIGKAPDIALFEYPGTGIRRWLTKPTVWLNITGD